MFPFKNLHNYNYIKIQKKIYQLFCISKLVLVFFFSVLMLTKSSSDTFDVEPKNVSFIFLNYCNIQANRKAQKLKKKMYKDKNICISKR